MPFQPSVEGQSRLQRVLVQISGLALSIWDEDGGWYWLLVEHSSAEKAPAAARISADQKMAVSFQQRELGTVGSAVWVNDHALWSS